jgi:ribosomal protein L34E
MIINEERPVSITYCDNCKAEITNASKCKICGKDLCTNKCTEFSFEIYRYSHNEELGDRFRGHLCKDCAELLKPLITAIEKL